MWINEPVVVAAAIASIPATIAAVAAYRSARRNTVQLQTGNGKTIGYVVQAMSDRMHTISERVDENSRVNSADHLHIVERLVRMEDRPFDYSRGAPYEAPISVPYGGSDPGPGAGV